MLKMSLKSLRGQIQVYPENWININYTTDYAYTLGLDIEEQKICKDAYVPGTMSSFINSLKIVRYFPYSKLEYKIKKDLKKLGISCRVIKPNYEINSDEWKMAIFVKYYDDERTLKRLENYKFMRGNSDGTWSYKHGYFNVPTNLDFSENIIEDPRKCDLGKYKYQKCYALRLKK